MVLFYYLTHNFWSDEGDPRTKNFPLFTGSPVAILTIMFSYLLFVKLIGPHLMKNRHPLDLRHWMLLYNTFMVVINAYFLYELVFITKFGIGLIDLNFPDPNDTSEETLRSINVLYLYYLTKLVDLLDTVFFVLRKKNSQVTHLHLYHHFSVPVLGWVAFKMNSPLMPALLLFAILNTTVHVVMYSYYALAAFGPNIQKYLWWKKYITILQIVQFVVLLLFCTITFPFLKGYKKIYLFLGLTQPPIYTIMFLRFYFRSYSKKTKSKTK